MSNLRDGDGADGRQFANISTGDLPRPERVQALVDEAHRRLLTEAGGANSPV